jgi:hypothetical protein
MFILNEFLTTDNHLDLDAVFNEVVFLYCNYCLEYDCNLTGDAKLLKNKVLKFINKIDKIAQLTKSTKGV